MQTCNQNHPLVWSTDGTGYMGGKFSCDGCHKPSECTKGRWSCKPCQYDICPNCKPAPAPFTFCNSNHLLEWSVDGTGYMGGKFSCDGCHKPSDCSSGRWSCKPCQYDICPNCKPAPLPFQTCKSNHPLEWSVDGAGYMAGKFSCDGCHKPSDCSNGRWSCKGCQFDICPNCRPAAMPFQTCKSNHPLEWSTDGAGYMAGKFSCDGCHKPSNCSNGRWSCKGCQFDICPNCRPAPVLFQTCANNHPLEWSTDGAGYMAGKFSCDGCHKPSDCANGRWSCKGCQYDICPNCRAPEAPLFGMGGMAAYLNCNNNHTLIWNVNTAGYMAGTFSCDLCKKPAKAGVGRWSCPACQYDICHNCRPPVDEQCKSGHTLALSTDAAGYMGGKFSCDKCHKPFNCADGRYTCPCQYDICPACKSS